MACSQVVQVVVRNTFLDIVDESPRRPRVVTDSALWCKSGFDAEDFSASLPTSLDALSEGDEAYEATSIETDSPAFSEHESEVGLFSSLVVKNTFLELNGDSPRRRRVQTDSAVWCDFAMLDMEHVSLDGCLGSDAEELISDDDEQVSSSSDLECDSTPCMMESRNADFQVGFHSVLACQWMQCMLWQQSLATSMLTASKVTQVEAAQVGSSGTRNDEGLQTSQESEELSDPRTTVMLRNLPNNYNAKLVLAMLEKEGFGGLYNFFYLPMDMKTHACKGYAFINLVHARHVEAFWRIFNRYSDWVIPSRKFCRVTWSDDQGLESFQRRYRDSALMHESVPDAYKPMMFERGERVAFTPPTRVLQAPVLRDSAR